MQAIEAANLSLVSYNDFTEHLFPSFQAILKNAEAYEKELIDAKVCPQRLHAHRTDLKNRRALPDSP